MCYAAKAPGGSGSGGVIGAIVGVIALLCICVCVYFCCCKKNKGSVDHNEPELGPGEEWIEYEGRRVRAKRTEDGGYEVLITEEESAVEEVMVKAGQTTTTTTTQEVMMVQDV